MAKKTIITDVKVVVEFDSYYYSNNLEANIRKKTDDAKTFLAFLKDHRSADEFNAQIVNESTTVCEFCGFEWEKEWDDNGPECCQDAIKEWESKNETTEVINN